MTDPIKEYRDYKHHLNPNPSILAKTVGRFGDATYHAGQYIASIPPQIDRAGDKALDNFISKEKGPFPVNKVIRWIFEE